ncbi:MAG: hypothetical protein C4288_21340 [Leptolyngbya sp. ERB_1_1]
MFLAGLIGSSLVGLLLLLVYRFSLAWNLPEWISASFAFLSSVQVFVALFNLLPIPPLDGYQLLAVWLPQTSPKWTMISAIAGLILLLILPIFLPILSLLYAPVLLGVVLFMQHCGISAASAVEGFQLLDRGFTGTVLLTGTVAWFAANHRAWFWKNRGLRLQRAGRHSEAIVAFDRALTLEFSEWTWSRKDWSAGELGRYYPPLLGVEQNFVLAPDDAWAWEELGWNPLKIGQYDASLQAIEKSLELTANDAWILEELGRDLQMLNCYEEAAQAFMSSLEIDPTRAWLWDELGWNLSRLDRYEDAVKAFERSLKIDPTHAWTWGYLGCALKRLGRYEEALEKLERSTTLYGAQAWHWSNKGEVLEQLGQYEQALFAYRKAMKLNPQSQKVVLEHPEAIAAWYIRATILRQFQAVQTALEKTVNDPEEF